MIDNEFDFVCRKCYGYEQDCDKCDGYGSLLTEKGQVVIEFLKRRGVDFGMSPKAEQELGVGDDYR